MPRKEARKPRKGSENDQWSDWVWSDQHNCYYRSRLDSRGKWEYEYHKPEPLPGPEPQPRRSTSSEEWKAPPEDRGRSQNYDPDDHVAQPGPPSVSPTRPRKPSPPPSPPPPNPPLPNPPPPKPNPPPSSSSEQVSADTYSGNYYGWGSDYSAPSYQGHQWPAGNNNSTYNADVSTPVPQTDTAATISPQHSRSGLEVSSRDRVAERQDTEVYTQRSQVLDVWVEELKTRALAGTGNASFISASFANKLRLEVAMASHGRTFETSGRRGKSNEIKVKKRVRAKIELLDCTGNRIGYAIKDWLYVLPEKLRPDEDVILGREHMAQLQSAEAPLNPSPEQQHHALPFRNSLGPTIQAYSPSGPSSQSPYEASPAYPGTYSTSNARQELPSSSTDQQNSQYGASDPALAQQSYPSPAMHYAPPNSSSSYEPGPPVSSSDISTDAKFGPTASGNSTLQPSSSSYPAGYPCSEPSTTSQSTDQSTYYSHDSAVIYEGSWRQ